MALSYELWNHHNVNRGKPIFFVPESHTMCIANALSCPNLRHSNFQIQLPLQPCMAAYEAMFLKDSFCVDVASFSSASLCYCLAMIWLKHDLLLLQLHCFIFLCACYTILLSTLNHITTSVAYIPTDNHLVVTFFPEMNHISGDLFSCWWWLLLVMTHASPTLPPDALTSNFFLLSKTHNFNEATAHFLMLVHSPFIFILFMIPT